MPRALRDDAVAVFRWNEISARYRREAPIVSSNYRSNVLLICAIYRRDIGEISEEQSAIFDNNRLNYFCTVLYIISSLNISRDHYANSDLTTLHDFYIFEKMKGPFANPQNSKSGMLRIVQNELAHVS